jgi:hypothetical protein
MDAYDRRHSLRAGDPSRSLARTRPRALARALSLSLPLLLTVSLPPLHPPPLSLMTMAGGCVREHDGGAGAGVLAVGRGCIGLYHVRGRDVPFLRRRGSPRPCYVCPTTYGR